MTDPESPLPSLMPILMRFSAESTIIRRLVLNDEGFRCMVEDYLLAHNRLSSLHKQVPPDPESIEDYATLLRDLEGEITIYLMRLRGGTF
jgi:hypothetical protein